MNNRLKSRKFWVTIGTVVSLLLVDALGVDLDKDTIVAVIVAVASYVVGQSWVDAHNGG